MELKCIVKLSSLGITPYRVYNTESDLIYIDYFEDGDWHADAFDTFDTADTEMLKLTLLKLEYSPKHIQVDYYEPYMIPYKL